MEPDLEALPRSNNRSGYLGVKVSSSGRFQPQLFTKTGEPQRGLGSFDTAEEAAKVRMAALMKRKREEAVWDGPVRKRAERGTVRPRCSALPVPPRSQRVPCSRWQASLDDDEREVLAIQKALDKARCSALKAEIKTELKAEKRSRNAAPVQPVAAAEPIATPKSVKHGVMARWLARGAGQSNGP